MKRKKRLPQAKRPIPKKTTGSKTTYLDPQGKPENSHTYKVSRDNSGHYARFDRLSGLGGVKIEASKYLTLADFKRENKRVGQKYFSPSTLRYFKSKFLSPLLYGRFFIEEAVGVIRINYANDDGSVSNFTEKTFKDKHSALSYLKKYLTTGQK